MDSLPKEKSAPRGILRYTSRPPRAEELEMVGMRKQIDNACGMVITVHENSSSRSRLAAPAKAYLPKIKTSGLTAGPSAATTNSEVNGTDHARSTMPPSLLPPPPLRSLAASARSETSSPTLVRSASAPSMEAETPVMRSLFPRYDPHVSLAKQHYYPRRENNAPMKSMQPDLGRSSSRTRSLSSMEENRSPNFSRPGVGAPGRQLAQESDSRQSFGNADGPPALSSPEELLDLWSVANGQGSQEAATTYTLRLSWYSILVAFGE